MQQQKIERLKTLAGILSGMTEENAMNILYDMDREFRIDRESLNFLAVSMFRPDEIFEKLERKGLTSLLRGMSLDSLSTLIELVNERNKNSCAEILGKNRFQDAVDIDRKPPRRRMVEEMLKVMAEKISAGEISYKGPALFLMDIPCRPAPEPGIRREDVFFRVLNPVVAKDEGVKVLIYNPLHTEGELRLSFQQRGERYFSKNNWFLSILTDYNGFYYSELFPERMEGMNTLWLEIPGAGQAGRNIYFTDSAKSVFSIMINRVSTYSDGRCSINFSLAGIDKTEEYARVRLFCSRCGHVLTAAGIKLEKNSGVLDFNIPSESKHSGELFLHVEAGKHQASTVINTENPSVLPIEPIIEKGRAPGDAVSIDLPVNIAEPFMYHVSTSMQGDMEIVQRIGSAHIPLHGKVKYTGQRKSTVLEAAEFDGELLVMPARDGISSLKFVLFSTPEKFEYCTEGWESFQDLYFTFYKLTSNGAEPFYRYVSCVDRNIRTYPVLPSYIEKGESAEIDILYRTESEMEISLTNGSSVSKKVKGRGVIRAPFGYGYDLELTCSSAGYNYNTDISVPERGEIIAWNTIEYIPPGVVLKPEKGTEYTIYRGPGDLQSIVGEIMLLNYPWGCAEQTAAKLAGICFSLVKGGGSVTEKTLIKLIENGARKLLSYKKANDLYSLFGDEADVAVTRLILRHLLPLRHYEGKLKSAVPVVVEILKSLIKVCGSTPSDEKAGPIPLITDVSRALSREVASPDISILNTASILENTGKYLGYKDEVFTRLSGDTYLSNPAYLSLVAASLITEGWSSLEAVTGEERRVNKLRRGGLMGFLEAIGLLSMRSETEVSKKTSVINDSLEPLLRSIAFSYIASGTMSTVDMRAFITLLSVLEEKTPEYSYSSGDYGLIPAGGHKIIKPVRVESDFTFVTKFTKENPGMSSGKINASLSSGRIVKGKNVTLKIKSDIPANLVYTVYYPAVLEPADLSGMIVSDQSVRVDSNTFNRNGGLIFKGARRGKGRVRIIYENMYDTSRAAVLDAGWIEVE
ncbi:MAG TPA: hypothetical protein P5120_17370 [Spirochaetota bacterium]|nr:hypothetical protein [Spirochaetota bacterium]